MTALLNQVLKTKKNKALCTHIVCLRATGKPKLFLKTQIPQKAFVKNFFFTNPCYTYEFCLYPFASLNLQRVALFKTRQEPHFHNKKAQFILKPAKRQNLKGLTLAAKSCSRSTHPTNNMFRRIMSA